MAQVVDISNMPPYLDSPASLAIEDLSGKYLLPRHLQRINEELLLVAAGVTKRLIINVPYQHGKTWLCSNYFPAWWILNFPNTRFLLAANEKAYAEAQGGVVRDIVGRWGTALGIELKADTQAKGEWRVVGPSVQRGFEGGMVCKGMNGNINGRPGDVFLIEDPIKNPVQALSPALLEGHWSFYVTIVYSRLSANAPIVVVTTRWGKNDLCGRILKAAESTGEEWRVVKFPAIAKEDDVLGRAPGEALCEWMKPLKTLEITRKMSPRWFAINYQQEDGEGDGVWFKVRDMAGRWLWPRYVDLRADAWSVPGAEGASRRIYTRDDLLVFIVVDWAYSKKVTADYTAMGVLGLTPGGDLLVLEVVHGRFGLTELAPAMARLCERWSPSLVGVEAGHPTLRDEYRRFASIPEVRWLGVKNKNKLQRSLQAISMGENSRIFLPDDEPAWLEPLVTQLMSFTGLDDDHEDLVDMLSHGANLALQMRGRPAAGGGDGPLVLTTGKNDAF